MDTPQPDKTGMHILLKLASLVVILAGIHAAADIIVQLLLALFFAIILNPLVNWFIRRGVRRPIAITIVVVVMLIALTALVGVLAASFNEFISMLPKFNQELTRKLFKLQEILPFLNLHMSPEKLLQRMDSEKLVTFTTALMTGLSGAMASVLLLVMTVVFMLFEVRHVPYKMRFALNNPQIHIAGLHRALKGVSHYLALKTLLSLWTGVIVWLELANQIIDAKALSKNELQITLKSAYYPFLQELALPRPFRFIAPSQFKNHETMNGIKAPIGTGPWVLQESKLNQYDVFIRNENYWGEKPAIKKITFKVIPDPTTRAVAFETGDIDLLYGNEGLLPLDTFARFSQNPAYHTQLSQPIETVMLALNTAKAPTNELAVREALNYAVNKKSLIDNALYGTQQVADTLFAPSVPYANLGLKPRQYDPQKAKALLEKTGWTLPAGKDIREKNGQPLRIELSFIGTDALSKSMAEIIQADMRQIGADVTLIGEEESSIYARQRDGRFGMIFHRTWGAPYDPHAFLSSMRVPSHADFQAQQGLADKPLIDKEIGEVLATHDETQRQALYRDILTRLHDEAVYLPISYISMMVVSKPELGNIPYAPIATEIPFEQIKPVKP